MLAQAQRGRVHADLAHVVAFAAALEREQRFELGVVGKAARLVEQHGAALVVDGVFALLGLVQALGRAVAVGGQKTGEIHIDAIAARRRQRIAGPEHRFGEGFARAGALGRIGRAGRVARVAFDQQHARTGAAEFDFTHVAGLAAVQTHIVGAQSVRQRRHEQQRRVELFHAEQQTALGRIAADREEAVLAGEAGQRIGRRLGGMGIETDDRQQDDGDSAQQGGHGQVDGRGPTDLSPRRCLR